jgi:Tfp pilus assembly protein PilF
MLDRTRAKVLSVAMLVLAGCVYAQQASNTVDVSTMQAFKAANASFNQAVEAYNKHDYDKAQKELEASLAKMPEFSDAHLMMAKILYIKKSYPEALERVERAKKGYETTALLLVRLRYERVDDLQKRKELQQQAANSLSQALGGSLPDEDRQKYERSLESANRTIEDIDRQLVEPPPQPGSIPAEYFFFHGNVLMRMQKPAEAAAQYEEALKINPAYADAATNLASLYYSARMYAKALEVLERSESKGAAVNAELKTAVQKALAR